MNRRKFVVSGSCILFVLIIWQIVAVSVDSYLILPKPLSVCRELVRIVSDLRFYKDVFFTLIRVLESFMLITVLGTVIGVTAGFYPVIEYFFAPIVSLFKATPVMSVILIAFFWFSGNTIPVFSAFLMAFPVMYVQMADGVHNVDTKLNEMCLIYGITGFRKVRLFIIPSLFRYFVIGAKQSLSMILKVVIAAEILTFPECGIGKSLQYAQMNLLTARVFALTAVAVVLTASGDWMFSMLSARLKRKFAYED